MGNNVDRLLAIGSILVAVGIPLFIWWRTTRRKRLVFQVLVEGTLLGVHQDVAERVEILFDGVKTRNVALLIIKFKNTGNEAIRKEDFESPLSVAFSELSEIISTEVVGTEPAELKQHLRIKNARRNKCQLNPCLMNPGDSITLKWLIREPGSGFEVDARVVGVKEITEESSTERAPHLAAIVFFIGIIISAVLIKWISFHAKVPKYRWEFISLVLSYSLGVMVMSFISVMDPRLNWRRRRTSI